MAQAYYDGARMRSLSPLRYPGSKPDLAEYFAALLSENLLCNADIVEPFAGSAALSLALLAARKVNRAFLVERDPLLYAFWRQMKLSPGALCDRINRVKVCIRTWHRMQRYLLVKTPDPSSVLDLATACVFLNRTNFSGILHAKPIGGISQSSIYPIDCRFNKKTVISSIENIACLMPQITVSFGDGVSYLRRNRRTIEANSRMVYVDPPYYEQGRKLYRYHYKDRDHLRLAEFLDSSTFRWVVSYDNHPFIRNLFKRQAIVPIFLNYVVKQSRRAEELLIANFPLLPVTYIEQGTKRRHAIRGTASMAV